MKLLMGHFTVTLIVFFGIFIAISSEFCISGLIYLCKTTPEIITFLQTINLIYYYTRLLVAFLTEVF